MKNFLNFFVLIILIFPINIFAQNINLYNINANLNSESKTLEINQIMKFKNTSDISLKEIILEDWWNSYVDNRTNLAKRISDEYSRSFSFAKKKQRGSTKIKTYSLGFLSIIFIESSSKFISNNLIQNSFLLVLPLVLILMIYFYFLITMKVKKIWKFILNF